MGQRDYGGELMAKDELARQAAADRYLHEFRSLVGEGALNGPPWVSEIRQRAISEFAESGFPAPRAEKWRFTNFSKLVETPFALRNGSEGRAASRAVAADPLGDWGEYRVVFVDGKYAPTLSSADKLPDGIYAGSLSAGASADMASIAGNLGQVAEPGDSPFTALNAAFMSDGAVLVVPPGVVLAQPIHFLHLTSDGYADAVTHARNLFVIGANAQVSVLQSFSGVGDTRYWTNAVTEIVLGSGAHLNANRTQVEGSGGFHTATTQCRQERDSKFSLTTVELGAALSRHDTGVILSGTGASCRVNGLVQLQQRQHVDNHTIIQHAAPHCTSREAFNGIFDDSSHGVFTGRIIVNEGAQQTDSAQSSRNVLLSEKARADAQPKLEIFADDVKCTHGATVGPIDEDALFYLRSKGLSADSARMMLIYGFAGEILDSISNSELRQRVDGLLRLRLSGDS